MSMSIDLTEPLAVGQQLAETVRRRTGDGFDAMREAERHIPVAAEAALAAATHRARGAHKHAKRAARDTRRSIEKQVDRGTRRVQRRAARVTNEAHKPGFRVWIIGTLLLGGVGAIAALALKKQRSNAGTLFDAPAAQTPITSDLNGSSAAADHTPERTAAP